jgi:2-polyprenyl-3-methyl-5-hydroxy-6-metoxy-1,4-benzoquinol methylase
VSGPAVSGDVEGYAARHQQFLTSTLPPLLAQVARPGVVVDLGCGDGALIWALHHRARLGSLTYAVDLSQARVDNAVQVAPGVTGIVADAAAVPLTDGVADGVICSQVIEHVPEDRALAREIARLLKPGGWWYVGTVLRGSRAWWVYKVDGVRVLDPTHVREYRAEEELWRVLDDPRLHVEVVTSSPMRYPISDLLIRAVGRGRRVTGVYQRVPEAARALKLRVPGYRLLEAAGTARPA